MAASGGWKDLGGWKLPYADFSAVSIYEIHI